MSSVFNGATAFNGNISTWDVSGVTNMNHMFRGAKNFNRDISSWNVSSLKFMGNMFNGAIAFNQNLSSWNVSGVTYMGDSFLGVTDFSAANYDKLLDGWSKLLSLQSNVSFGAPPTYYCNVTARDILVNTFSWTISGDTEGTTEQCTTP